MIIVGWSSQPVNCPSLPSNGHSSKISLITLYFAIWHSGLINKIASIVPLLFIPLPLPVADPTTALFSPWSLAHDGFKGCEGSAHTVCIFSYIIMCECSASFPLSFPTLFLLKQNENNLTWVLRVFVFSSGISFSGVIAEECFLSTESLLNFRS